MLVCLHGVGYGCRLSACCLVPIKDMMKHDETTYLSYTRLKGVSHPENDESLPPIKNGSGIAIGRSG